MSVTVKVTNLSSAPISISEIYTDLGASGSSNDNITFTRSMAQIDSMLALKALLSAGTVSVVMTNSSDNEDLMSIPSEQHGAVAGLAVSSATALTGTVTFTDAFPSGVVPKVFVSTTMSVTTTAKATAYARAVVNTGFTYVLDVTTSDSAAVTTEAQTTTPAQNGVLLGPFTSTLAKPPVTAAAITLHWLESTVAKSATVTGTSTLGGTNAANLAAATINRTTGALSVTFATAHPPDVASLTVDYVQVRTMDLNWMAVY